MSAVKWEPGKPWTHPSIQQKGTDELRVMLANAEAKYREVSAQFVGAKADLDDVSELLESYQVSIDTYRKALQERDA